MTASTFTAGRPDNWVLAALPERQYRQLLPGLEPVIFERDEVLFEAGQPIPHVYFPCGGLVSLLAPVEGDKVAEVAVVGKEGVVGLPAFLGGGTSTLRALVQGPGPALRGRTADFRDRARRNPALNDRLLRYADAFLVQVAQSAVCNCLHPVPKRYCRWLLMAHDRVGSDRLPFTQKHLALMLTVRLASISEATGSLERAGLIHYRRGEFHILDRPGLEAAACGCYRLIHDYFARLPQ